MGFDVREKSIEEIEDKLSSISTDLNKIAYLESALKSSGFSLEIRRFILKKLALLYGERKMFERAARAMSKKAALDVTFREKIDSCLEAAEFFCKAGKVDDAEEMFVRAKRDANKEQLARVELAKKNIYFVMAKEFESRGKRAGALKFYEKLVRMNLDDSEKMAVREKLKKTYKALGLFREARLFDGR
ncbi:hypothetical protein D6829_02880 [Candidatus Pacearchaeota archaeon]|nr:MAG: hypothetical protein D6829_02880 [Candidatus Pacearchaeota archaeon]